MSQETLPFKYEEQKKDKGITTLDGVKKVRLRSDNAGYQHDLLKYYETKKNKRFGRIEFAIGCDVTETLLVSTRHRIIPIKTRKASRNALYNTYTIKFQLSRNC